MESASGPTRSNSVSPRVARRVPYARPGSSLEQVDKRPSGLLGSLMRKGLGWLTGSPQARPAPEAVDEEEAVESRRGGLSRSHTLPSMADVNGSPAPRSSRRNAPPSVPASLSAYRSSSPDRSEARTRTAHSRLDLPISSSSSTLSFSRSYADLQSANASGVFPSGASGRSPVDPYHPSAYMRSNSPFATGAPPLHNLQLRSPSPTLPSPARSNSGHALYPHLPASGRKRALSPLNPASERSHASGRPMAWSPTRGQYGQPSLGGSSIAGSSRQGDVFGRSPSVTGDGIPVVPKNEAEKILNVLESIRTPFGGPSTRRINVPVAVPSANGDLGYSSTNRSAFISPYMRRQEQEREVRQEARRSTLSEALRQRDLDAAEQRRQRRRSEAGRAPSKLRQRVDDGAEEDEPRRQGKSRKAERKGPATSRRARRDRSTPERRGADTTMREADDADTQDGDQETPPKRSRRGNTPRLSSPGRNATKKARSRSPAPPVPDVRSPPPVASTSTAPANVKSPPSEAQRPLPRQQTNSLRPGRTHTSRQHVKSSTTFAVDDDDDDEEPADYEALSKVTLPKIAFPAGFFGTPAAPAKASETPTASTSAPLASLPPALPDALSSASEVPKAAPVAVPPRSVPAPFSFAAPASSGPAKTSEAPFTASSSLAAAAAPVASPANPFAAFTGFGAAEKKPDEVVKPAAFSFAPASGSATPAASSFGFSPATSAAESTDDAMAADEKEEPATEGSAPASPAPAAEPAAPTPPSAPFAFGGTTPASSFAAPVTTAATSAPLFSFANATATTSASGPPSFSFTPASGTPVSSTPMATSGPFAFNAPTATTTQAASSFGTSTPAPFSFGAPKADEATPFGKPVEAPAAKPFSFGASVASGAGSAPPSFSFGAPKASETATSAAPLFPTSSAPSLGGFGKPAESPFSFGSAAPSAAMEPSESAETMGSMPSQTPNFFASSAPPTANGPAPAFGSSSTPTANPFAPTATPVSNPFGAATSMPAQVASGAFGSQPPAANPFAAFTGTSSSTPAANPFPAAASSTSFGGFGASAPAPAFGASAPAPAFGGFGSAPPPAASPGFTFGAVQPNGSSAPAFGGGFGSSASNPPSTGFSFGAGTQSGTTTPFTPPAVNGGATGGFPFGAMPAAPGAEAGPSLFAMGSAGDTGPPGSPTGRRVKPLPSRRGRK